MKIPAVFDSGAHSLYTDFVLKRKKKGLGSQGSDDVYSLYDSQVFWDYVDNYAAQVKQYPNLFNWVAVVDIIFDPVRTKAVCDYMLKKHKLRPMPVVHFGTDPTWVAKYIQEGYEYIGIGGLGQEAVVFSYSKWADEIFTIVCDKKTKLCRAKLHGFAVTSFRLMRRYPWYSVDSTAWIQYGAYGKILFPKRVAGTWDYSVDPLCISVSSKSPDQQRKGKHLSNCSPAVRAMIQLYCEERKFSLEEIREKDVLRTKANMVYFIDFVRALPKWPWPWERFSKKGFAL
jgi:hypothetical protein